MVNCQPTNASRCQCTRTVLLMTYPAVNPPRRHIFILQVRETALLLHDLSPNNLPLFPTQTPELLYAMNPPHAIDTRADVAFFRYINVHLLSS